MNMFQKTKTQETQETQEAQDETRSQPPRSNMGKRLRILVFIVLGVGIAIGYVISIAVAPLGATPEDVAQKEIKSLVEKVSKLILIPETSLPALATVVDAEALAKEQAFYSGVQDGDKILLFIETQRAIIYSPSRNKIVNVGPIYVQPNSGDLNQEGSGEVVETLPEQNIPSTDNDTEELTDEP